MGYPQTYFVNVFEYIATKKKKRLLMSFFRANLDLDLVRLINLPPEAVTIGLFI